MKHPTLAIHKYDNRKYYCLTTSSYINLSEIFLAVKEGSRVTVLDKDTKEDITKETLISSLHQNFIQNKDRIDLKDVEETIQTLDESYNILDKV